MKLIQKVIKTSTFDYKLVQFAAEHDPRCSYAVIAPDGEIIEEGLDLRDGLATLRFIDPPGVEGLEGAYR